MGSPGAPGHPLYVSLGQAAQSGRRACAPPVRPTRGALVGGAPAAALGGRSAYCYSVLSLQACTAPPAAGPRPSSYGWPARLRRAAPAISAASSSGDDPGTASVPGGEYQWKATQTSDGWAKTPIG